MSVIAAVTIDRSAYEMIAADCAARYPEEACGILIGEDRNGARRIMQARPAANVWEAAGEKFRRFRIDPAAQLLAERDAAKSGLEVVGFYHSHPDAPPDPSPRDADAAWPFYSYLILTSTAGGNGELGCWFFDDAVRQFQRQSMLVR